MLSGTVDPKIIHFEWTVISFYLMHTSILGCALFSINGGDAAPPPPPKEVKYLVHLP